MARRWGRWSVPNARRPSRSISPRSRTGAWGNERAVSAGALRGDGASRLPPALAARVDPRPRARRPTPLPRRSGAVPRDAWVIEADERRDRTPGVDRRGAAPAPPRAGPARGAAPPCPFGQRRPPPGGGRRPAPRAGAPGVGDAAVDDADPAPLDGGRGQAPGGGARAGGLRGARRGR